MFVPSGGHGNQALPWQETDWALTRRRTCRRCILGLQNCEKEMSVLYKVPSLGYFVMTN